MRSRIDFEAMVEDPLHWVRIALYIGVIAALFIPLGYAMDQFLHRTGGVALSLLGPDMIAGGKRVEEGIAAFRGAPKPPVQKQEIAGILVALSVTGVLLPALFFWGVRRRAQWRIQPGSRGLLVRISLALAAGGFSILLMLGSIPLSLISWDTEQIMRRDNRVSASRDQLVAETLHMATKARILYFLPAERGGLHGEWMTRDAEHRPTIAINAIRIPAVQADSILARIYPPFTGVFGLDVVNPDSLVIWGVGMEKNSVADTALNRDGRRGMIQVEAGVTPDRAAVSSFFY